MLLCFISGLEILVPSFINIIRQTHSMMLCATRSEPKRYNHPRRAFDQTVLPLLAWPPTQVTIAMRKSCP